MATTPTVFDVTEASFERDVLEASHTLPVLVDFWAEWCPPCSALTPVLERLAAASADQWRLAKVEADDNMRLAGRYQLRGFPTVIVFGAGTELGRFSGARSETWVREFLADVLRAQPARASRL